MARTSRRIRVFPIRLSEADLAVIDRAAARRSCSRVDFVREVAIAAAEDVLIEQTSVRMSADGFGAFTEALSKPPTVISEIVELFQRPAPWE